MYIYIYVHTHRLGMMYIDAYINNIYIYGIVWLLPEMGNKQDTLDFNDFRASTFWKDTSIHTIPSYDHVPGFVCDFHA